MYFHVIRDYGLFLGGFVNTLSSLLSNDNFSSMELPAEYSSEPESVKRFILDEPNRWEHLLASELLKVRMGAVNVAFEELESRAGTDEKTMWGHDEFILWVEASTHRFVPFIGVIESILGIELEKALGPPGLPADLNELRSVAGRIEAHCQDLLAWDRDAIMIAPPMGFEDAVNILREWPRAFLNAINDFIRQWEYGFNQPANAVGVLAVSISVNIVPPPRSKELLAMIARHSEKTTERLKSLHTFGSGSSVTSRPGLSSEVVIDRLSALSFTAIDFETANEQRTSLCAIGVAKVENGVIVKTWKQLVQPAELRVDPVNQAINRISLEDLVNAPTFPEVWDEFMELIADSVLVAHNAEFDMNVLQQVLDHYGLDEPDFRSICTLKLSHVAFPQLTDYRLVDVTKYLGLEFRHHDCDEDARVCAEIAIQAIPRIPLDMLDLSDVDLTRSFIKAPSQMKRNGFSEAFSDKRIESDLLKPQLAGADSEHPFYGKRLVFTGDLRKLPRNEAAALVRALGADINTSISKKTQIVVIGDGAGPSKMRKIVELQDQGIAIQIIFEDEFFEILG